MSYLLETIRMHVYVVFLITQIHTYIPTQIGILQIFTHFFCFVLSDQTAANKITEK